MPSKIASIIALAFAVAGVLFLYNKNYILSKNPVAIVIQLFAVALMVWARITFGIRSFHAAANTTEGGLVTNGPYHWLRHPIYAALIYFFWACAIAYPFLETVAAAALITISLFVRMLLEEKFLLITYPEYPAYMKNAKRIIPFIF